MNQAQALLLWGLCLLLGITAGLGVFTFTYAEGHSYLTDDPQACANCHVMNDQLDSWAKSSHHAVAVCNDCHAPANTLAKYYTKALNGAAHSWAFTLGRFHEPIQITERNRQVTEAACRNCHESISHSLDTPSEPTSCLRCHRSVGHLH